jgi:hypothetical protein
MASVGRMCAVQELFMTFMFSATPYTRTLSQFGRYVACEPVSILLLVGLRYGFGGPLERYNIQFALASFVNLEGEPGIPENIRGHRTTFGDWTMVGMQSIPGKINNKILDITLGSLDLKTLRLHLCILARCFGIGFVVGFRCTRVHIGDDTKVNHVLRKMTG